MSPFSGLISLLLAFTAIAYLRGLRRLRTTALDIPARRTASFLAGLLCTWVAAASPVAFLDHHLLTAHMAQHLLLMTIAPPLIWLGSPVRVLGWRPLWARPLGHPAFCWLSAAATLTAWHAPALLRLGMESGMWHSIEHASFLVSGLLFWWPVVQPWPSAPRWPRWSMLLYLFLATLPCDVLAGFLVFSDRVAYPVYLCTPRQSGFSALEDQQCAGALMWTVVTLVFLVAGTVLSTQLLSPAGAREEPAGGGERCEIMSN
jgi:putative membrane protein